MTITKDIIFDKNLVLLFLCHAIITGLASAGDSDQKDFLPAAILKFDVVQNKFIPHCQGVPIHKNWIITSVHCTEGVTDFRQLIFTTGKACTSANCPGEIWHYFLERYIHPKYNSSTKEFNVALLRIEPPLHFEGQLQMVKLPSEDFTCKGDIFSFWEENSTPRKINLIHFERVKMNVLNVERCSEEKYSDSNFICNDGVLNTILADDDTGDDRAEGEMVSGAFCSDRNDTILYGIFSQHIKTLTLGQLYMFTNIKAIDAWVKQVADIPIPQKYDMLIYFYIAVLLSSAFVAIAVLVKLYTKCPSAIRSRKENHYKTKLLNIQS